MAIKAVKWLAKTKTPESFDTENRKRIQIYERGSTTRQNAEKCYILHTVRDPLPANVTALMATFTYTHKNWIGNSMSAIISLLGVVRYNLVNRELLKAKELATGSRLFSNRSANDDTLPLREKLSRRRLMNRLNGDVNQVTRRRMTTKRYENPFEHNQLIRRIGGQRIRSPRQLHSYYNLRGSAELRESDYRDETWSPVYRFHSISTYAFVSRLKMLQTIGSALLMPYCYYRYLDDELSGAALAVMSGAAIFAPFFFIIFTRYFNRIIGVISINESRTIIRIGRLSFWGSRENIYIPIEDIVSLTEGASNPRHSFTKLYRYSMPKQHMILSTRNVEICDVESAKAIFGTIDYFVVNGALVSDRTADDDESAYAERRRSQTGGSATNDAFDAGEKSEETKKSSNQTKEPQKRNLS